MERINIQIQLISRYERMEDKRDIQTPFLFKIQATMVEWSVHQSRAQRSIWSRLLFPKELIDNHIPVAFEPHLWSMTLNTCKQQTKWKTWAHSIQDKLRTVWRMVIFRMEKLATIHNQTIRFCKKVKTLSCQLTFINKIKIFLIWTKQKIVSIIMIERCKSWRTCKN